MLMFPLLLVPEFHRVGRKSGAFRFADCTASGEFHPALKTFYFIVFAHTMRRHRDGRLPILYQTERRLQPEKIEYLFD